MDCVSNVEKGYGIGHQCKVGHANYMILEDEEDSTFEDALGEQDEQTGNPGQAIEISLHALSEALKRKTITLIGILDGEEVLILVDTGSSDSYINSELVIGMGINYKWVDQLYPHYHNEEIEKQVAKMLQKDIVKYNNSPFASPVLLVKKKEGTWRFCVNYRKLNEITINDKFPIPNVDELLDELTDASGGGISVFFMQEGYPIAFLSKALSIKNLGLSVYEKELLALVMPKLNIAIQHNWMTKLLGLDYEIQYKKGAENQVIDALSRRHEATPKMALRSCLAITTVKPGWIEELQRSYEGMKQRVISFVQNYDICQKNKSKNVPYPGLLQPIPVPKQAWLHISMDFIEKLPRSQGYDTILVVLDRFTKFGHFMMLIHPFTAKNVAQVFLDNIYKLHGLLESIITDRDKVFTSGFWKELFKIVEIELYYSSSYHPQTDGQSKRLNQCVENYLRCMTGELLSQWRKWLSLAEWWYNSTYHSSLDMTPFEALFGYKPTPLPLGPYLDSVVPVVSNTV
ncbi:uncharacterized protein [Coffea arabica]|uniref:Integrase catalytic domain-containing protein n=1 Tax=Coffea arabica TaxID=13443 RepID=A0ABM4X734_COFAR